MTTVLLRPGEHATVTSLAWLDIRAHIACRVLISFGMTRPEDLIYTVDQLLPWPRAVPKYRPSLPRTSYPAAIPPQRDPEVGE
jgi:hypothetical protein